MKRNRKNYGITSRKFSGMNKSELCKAAARNTSIRDDRAQVARILDGVMNYFAERAKDRPNFGRSFLALWQNAIDCVRDCAEKMLTEPEFVSVPEEPGLSPYSLIALSGFSALMDNLTYEEEEALRDLLTRLDGAWGMYFSVMRMRWPKLAPSIDRAAEIRECLQLEVQRLFFGEIVPSLTARWVIAYDGLAKSMTIFARKARHDLA